ncbi:MAG TPA: hypothetical protein VFD39_12790 [Trueperaceae bacterium]|nr:hypothetical protein [Trueperaceae bacterium]
MSRWSAVRGLVLRLTSAVALGLFAGLALATTYRFMTPAELLADADVVFTARVVDVTAAVHADKAYEEVYTTVSFAVEEVLRGYGVRMRPDQVPPAAGGGDQGDPDLDDPAETPDPDELAGPPDTIELDFLGGEAPGDRRLLVAGSPTWRTGETVLVAAYLDPNLASPLTGFRQGLWRLSDDAFIDVDGRALGLDPNGRLVRTDLPGAQAAVLEAIRSLLSGEAPSEAPAAEDDAGEVPEEPAVEVPEEPPLDEEPLQEPGEEPRDQADAPPGEAPAEDQPTEPVVVTYSVDDAGGPLLLSEAVAEAAATWQEISAGAAVLSAANTAPFTLTYGDMALFSPETLSLTLVSDAPSAGEVTALLSPAAGEWLPRAVHHELGLLLGLPAGGPGVMAMAVEAPAALPGEAELAELSAVNRFAPGDLSRDGVVDFPDLLEFALAYGRTGLNLPADLDGDGDVDDDDLALLREDYQLTEPARPE